MLLCWSSALSALAGGYSGRPLAHKVFGHQHGAGDGVETCVIPSSGGPEWGVYSYPIGDRVEEKSDRDSGNGWDEDERAGVSLVDLEGIRTYSGQEVEEEEENVMGDGLAERGAAAQGELYLARDHDSRALMITLSVESPSGYSASFLKNVAMVVWEEPQLVVFETAKSNSSPTATLTRWRVFEVVCTIGTR
jgi:hypothetical protein